MIPPKRPCPVMLLTRLSTRQTITQMSTLDGVSVSQIVMVWRVDNLVNSITGQGRFGGITLDDLLTVAHAQTADEEQAGPTSS